MPWFVGSHFLHVPFCYIKDADEHDIFSAGDYLEAYRETRCLREACPDADVVPTTDNTWTREIFKVT